MADKESVYVDEDAGKDDGADGTIENPYKTLLNARQHHPSESHYLTRKSLTGPVSEDGDPAARLEYKPASKSALKKMTTMYEQLQKKAAKADQLALREKDEAARRQTVLEEAKKVKLDLDTSLPEPKSIYLDEKDVKLKQGDHGKGTRVRVRGRIHRLRSVAAERK